MSSAPCVLLPFHFLNVPSKRIYGERVNNIQKSCRILKWYARECFLDTFIDDE